MSATGPFCKLPSATHLRALICRWSLRWSCGQLMIRLWRPSVCAACLGSASHIYISSSHVVVFLISSEFCPNSRFVCLLKLLAPNRNRSRQNIKPSFCLQRRRLDGGGGISFEIAILVIAAAAATAVRIQLRNRKRRRRWKRLQFGSSFTSNWWWISQIGHYLSTKTTTLLPAHCLVLWPLGTE